MYDPISQFVYMAQLGQAADAWIAGKCQLNSGQLSHIDVDALMERSSKR
jgi:hypothetical protein|tara:strand:+ start:548 stop:694 length:147 start_codon:yes stop_codon:yes gene_type:complete